MKLRIEEIEGIDVKGEIDFLDGRRVKVFVHTILDEHNQICIEDFSNNKGESWIGTDEIDNLDEVEHALTYSCLVDNIRLLEEAVKTKQTRLCRISERLQRHENIFRGYAKGSIDLRCACDNLGLYLADLIEELIREEK